MSDGNVSAQNNVTTAAEYQTAADEITAIIDAQRAERAPLEAEQVLLQNRAELLFERQQQALNTLRAAEADPGDTAFLEQSRLAYNRATGEVNAINTAIQQNRSVLAQSRQSTAILQDQRSTLEVLAEFAEQGPPNQNSLPPPATTTPGQAATFVPTPPAPIPPTVYPASQPATVTVTATASAQNNVTTAAEFQQAADEITAIVNAQRAERAPLEAELDQLRVRADTQAQRQQTALDALRDAEDIGDAAARATATTAYQRATNDLVVTSQAQQQIRSSLAQSRQSTAELQEQRGRLETNADLAAKGAPPLNSLPPPATTVPDQTATFVPTPPGPIPPTVAPASQPATAAPTATASAQNNVTTAAEYQAAADEITAIVNAQRAELLIPLEAEQELLQNRREILIARQRSALNTLQAAEAAPSETAFLEASRTAYARATGEVEATNFAIQQNRSVLAQSRQSTAELQEQRGRLEVNADLAAKGAPPLNSLPPPATVVPDQAVTTVTPPPPPIIPAFAATTVDGTAGEAEAQAALQAQAPAQNNVSTAEQWDETTFEISSAQRTIRAENFAAAENVANLNQQLIQASRARQLARDNLDQAIAAGASDAEIAALDAQRQTALNTAVQLEQQIEREQSVIASNQQTLNLLEQQRFIADEAALAARSGPPGLNSVPPPATVIPDQDPAAYDLPPTTYADSFQAKPVSADGDEALQAIEDVQAANLAAQEGVAFAEPVTLDDPEARAIQDTLDADLAAQEGQAFPPIDSPSPVSGDEALQAIEDAQVANLAAQEGIAFATSPAPVLVEGDEAIAAAERAQAEARGRDVVNPDAEALALEAQARETKAKLAQAQQQATIQQRFNQTTKGDWRVRIRIAPEAAYLYQDPNNRLLAPLKVSDGVVFPYTPQISTNYSAKYDAYDLTHSNYRGYFYKNSSVNEISIGATFTAQDTLEAQYVLAVIHFFRSVTKMFYGKDQQRGTPPPLVYLRGYGEYQFNDHACLVSNFQYNLPNDVDYISVTPNNQGLNMSQRQAQVSSSPVSTITGAVNRLGKLQNSSTGNSGVPKGAIPTRQDLGAINPLSVVGGTQQTTYVPTKLELQIILLPVQTRSQVSREFSLQGFANGDLLRKGYW